MTIEFPDTLWYNIRVRKKTAPGKRVQMIVFFIILSGTMCMPKKGFGYDTVTGRETEDEKDDRIL